MIYPSNDVKENEIVINGRKFVRDPIEDCDKVLLILEVHLTLSTPKLVFTVHEHGAYVCTIWKEAGAIKYQHNTKYEE